MTYRDDLAALAARHAALEHEVAAKTSELARASQLLEEASTRARLPVLDNIRVASPCSMAWDKMAGDDRTRHCGACDKSVYNLSSLTRDEAEALIVEKAGKLCVRYFQRADGTILLDDCTVGVSRRRRRRVIAAGAAVLLAGTAVFAGRVLRAPEQHAQQVLGGLDLPITSEVVDVQRSERVEDDVAHASGDLEGTQMLGELSIPSK